MDHFRELMSVPRPTEIQGRLGRFNYLGSQSHLSTHYSLRRWSITFPSGRSQLGKVWTDVRLSGHGCPDRPLTHFSLLYLHILALFRFLNFSLEMREPTDVTLGEEKSETEIYCLVC